MRGTMAVTVMAVIAVMGMAMVVLAKILTGDRNDGRCLAFGTMLV